MKILIIEDEHRIAQAIKKGLEQERYTVDLAFDGNRGFDLASSGDFDLVILDLMLPGMDGLTLCHELRAQNIEVPVLILSARGQVVDRIDGLNNGADDYLTKPFSFEELLARVKALLRRPKAISQTKLKVEDLILDVESGTVIRRGTNIRLSSREFSLLEYLMRHKGKVLSKDQIINSVWDYDSNVLPNTVEAFIKNLRKKVDEPFGKELIHTMRGFGYKLE